VLERVLVLILNHPSDAVSRFSRHGAALSHYQQGPWRELVLKLSNEWFSVAQACIAAHHAAVMKDHGETINSLYAVNPHRHVIYQEFVKPKGKVAKFLFVIFEGEESTSRALVYQELRPFLFANHPVAVDVRYHNVGFI